MSTDVNHIEPKTAAAAAAAAAAAVTHANAAREDFGYESAAHSATTTMTTTTSLTTQAFTRLGSATTVTTPSFAQAIDEAIANRSAAAIINSGGVNNDASTRRRDEADGAQLGDGIKAHERAKESVDATDSSMHINNSNTENNCCANNSGTDTTALSDAAKSLTTPLIDLSSQSPTALQQDTGSRDGDEEDDSISLATTSSSSFGCATSRRDDSDSQYKTATASRIASQLETTMTAAVISSNASDMSIEAPSSDSYTKDNWTDSISICSDYRNNNNNNVSSDEQEVLSKKSRSDQEHESQSNTQYIEINPLASHHKLSPTLIYLCTFLYSLIPLGALLVLISIIALLFTRFYIISILYVVHVLYTRNRCNTGGQRIDAVYKSKFYTYLAAYFPIKFRHTASFKLSPQNNYILAYHPHGISSFGAVAAFATNGLSFNYLFPDIRSVFMVHESCFTTPVLREVFATRGDCSVNSRSIDYMLTRRTTGNLLCLVTGGLAEADLSHKQKLKLVLANRKGFVKKALMHGAHLVPCLAFGENSVFDKIDLKPGSLSHKLERGFYRIFGFTHPVYNGHSVISENLPGVMPYKKPITLVMGDPIAVEKVSEPTSEDIDKLHALYVAKIEAMYKANSDLCKVFDQSLEIV